MIRRPPLYSVARTVIATSGAYYGLDESLIPDSEFDALCLRLHEEWDDLDQVTKWKLGNPHSIRASGFHVRMSMLDVGGLFEVLRRQGRLRYQITAKWKSPSDELPDDLAFRWAGAGDIAWDKRKPIQ